MKKILLSLLTIALVSIVAVGATRAYFSDTETSVGNSFTAGTLDLKVDNQDDPSVVHITKSNMKPQAPWTYQGYNQQWILKNSGSLPGAISITVKNIKNIENGCIEPELGLSDITCGSGDDQGELGQYTWVDWGNNGGSVTTPFTAPKHFDPLNTANNVVVTGPVLQPGDTYNAYMWLDFPRRTDNMENLAQGDGMQFDVEFKLVQLP
jgi:predicted ribosomally synthesized peptide with SipW-like signal peptide